MCSFILSELGVEVGERPPSPGLPSSEKRVCGMGKAVGGSSLEPCSPRIADVPSWLLGDLPEIMQIWSA